MLRARCIVPYKGSVALGVGGKAGWKPVLPREQELVWVHRQNACATERMAETLPRRYNSEEERKDSWRKERR